LQPAYREALILIAAGGFTYEETAEICHCAVGTIKSRVFRARRQLAVILEDEEPLAAPRPRERDATQEIMSQLAFLTSRNPPCRGGAAAGLTSSPPI
jgi:hypothetical protein